MAVPWSCFVSLFVVVCSSFSCCDHVVMDREGVFTKTDAYSEGSAGPNTTDASVTRSLLLQHKAKQARRDATLSLESDDHKTINDNNRSMEEKRSAAMSRSHPPPSPHSRNSQPSSSLDVSSSLFSNMTALTTATFLSPRHDLRLVDSIDDVSTRRLRHFRSLPTAIIIGVKKCGTRALLEFLRAHPEVRATGPETHFFDRYYDLGLDWYRSQMPMSASNQMTIEKTPSYFVTEEVPERISRMSNSTRLIVVVRDPVTRALSHYTQVLAKRSNIPAFEQLALSNASSSTSSSSSSGPPPPPPAINGAWGALRLGLYADHLEKWLRFFPLERLHFVSGERLVGDPGAELERVQEFLRLRRILTKDDFAFSRSKGFPCLLLRRGRRRETADFSSTSSSSSSTSSSSSVGRQRLLHCLGENKGRIHPSISPFAVTLLRQFFRPHNEKFYRMTGIDFDWP